MPEWVTIAAVAVIVARLTWAITRDDIAAPLRRLIGNLGKTAAAFVSCPWCIGWWISVCIYATAYAITVADWSDAPRLIVWFAASQGTNLVTAAGIVTWEVSIASLARIGAAAEEAQMTMASASDAIATRITGGDDDV